MLVPCALLVLALMSVPAAQASVLAPPSGSCETQLVAVGCTYYTEYCDSEEYNHQYPPEGGEQGCMPREHREYCEVILLGECEVDRIYDIINSGGL